MVKNVIFLAVFLFGYTVQAITGFAGTGAAALLSRDNAPLAGAAGEAVPAGSGRDACLFATYPSTAA